MLGYWRTWLAKAEAGIVDLEYPQYSTMETDIGDLEDVHGAWVTTVVDSSGKKFSVPSVSKLRMTERRVLVSKKRTKNLFDFTTRWKQHVLRRYETAALDDMGHESDVSESDLSDNYGRTMARGFLARHGAL